MESRKKLRLGLAAALLVAAVSSAVIVQSRRQAESKQVADTMFNLLQAIDRHHSEYNKQPATGSFDFTTDSPAGRKLLAALVGDNSHGEGIRAVCLLESSPEDLKLTPAERVDQGLADPWGNPFQVILDDDYDDRITVDAGDGVIQEYHDRALIVSRGRDGIAGTKDDIRSHIGSPTDSR